jgi:hypothetical protein
MKAEEDLRIISIAVAMKIELESALYFLPSFLHVNKNK